MVSLRHPAWVWQGAGVQTTARLLPFVLQCSGTRSPDDWSLYSGCIRLTLRHDVWHMRKKVTRPPTKRHLIVRRQKPDQLPARGAPFRVFQVVTRTRDRPVPGQLSWTMVLVKIIGLEWWWCQCEVDLSKKRCLPVFWAAFDSHSLGTEATAAWKIEKSGFGKKLMF